MKKNIKLFILGILITVFGLYFISNSTNVYAETSYDEISSNSFVNQNCYVNQSIASLSENELPINPNQVYKPTFYEAYQDSYAIQYNYSSLYTTLNTASISLKTNYSNGEYHIYTNNIDVYESNSAYHLKLSQISVITLTHKGQFDQGHALRYINYIASSSTNELTLKNKNFEYVLLKYTEYSVGPNLPCGREVKASNGDSFVTEAYCYLIAKVTFANKDFQNNKKYVISNSLSLGNYCKAYKCDESNPTNPTTLYSNSSLNDEGKYLMKTFYSDGSLDKKFYIYLITDNTFSICRSDGNKINSSHPTNDTTVYLKFNTSLSPTFINEIVDTITLDGQTYEGSTKSKFINGEGLAVATTNQISSCQINGGFFKSSLDGSDKYEFTIDTKSPELNLESANNYGCSQNDNNFLFYGSVNISFTEGTLKLNGSEYTKDIITEEGTYKLELTDSAGNTTTKNLYIQKLDYLKAVYIKASKETTSENIFKEPTVAKYSQQIKFMGYDSITINGITFSVTYDLFLDGIKYEAETPITEEGEHTIKIVYNTGYETSYQFIIDRTAPYLNKNYLQSQGYNQGLLWYNTTDENGNTYSFSYYDINESNRLGVYQYSYNREKTYFTLKIPYSEEWKNYSIPNDTTFKDTNKINLNSIPEYDIYNENKSDGWIYIYKNNNDIYVAYFRYENYESALLENINKNIIKCYKWNTPNYNPYPNESYQYYFTYNDLPIFYMNSNYSFKQEYYNTDFPSITYQIINSNGKEISKIEENNFDLYKIIETDKAGNSTSYYIAYNNENPSAIISPVITGSKNYNEEFTISPGLAKNDATASQYSFIKYTYTFNNQTKIEYYSCYDYINNEYNSLICSEDGIYTFTIYSVYNNKSKEEYTVKLYQKDIITNSSIIYDDEDEPTELLIKFSLDDAIQTKQFNQIIIYKDDVELKFDSNGNEIAITNSNEYEFHFKENGYYEIRIKEICGQTYNDNFYLTLGKPSGKLWKNVYGENGAEEVLVTDATAYNNNIVYFRWNPSKTSYKATIINLKNNSESNYSNGTAISQEGKYKIVLVNGDNTDEDEISSYYIIIDKTAPLGTIKDGDTSITKTNYITGNKDGITFSWNDASPSEAPIEATINNVAIENGHLFIGKENEEKEYIIVLKDLAGNETQYTIKLDYKIADIKIICNLKEILNGAYVNQPFKFTCDEAVTITNLSDNNSIVPLDKKISYEYTDKIMEYNFIVKDAYNNTAYYTIYYDNTTPSLKFEHISEDNTLTEIYSKATINNAFKISWDEAKAYTVKLSYTDNDINNVVQVNNGTIINTELNPNSLKLQSKKYTISVTNQAGTESIYYIYLCNTFLGCDVYQGTKLQDPSIKNFITNRYVKFNFSDATAMLNGSEYKSNTKIEDDGYYKLIITDIYNNSYNYEFTIDTIAPKVNLNSTTSIINNGTNGDITFEISEESKIYLVTEERKTEYPLNFIYSNEGKYQFEIIDNASNVTSISFIIDKTAPTFEVTGFTTNPNVTKENVKFTWDESNVKATINGNAYKSNTKIEEDGEYEFILSDIYGNKNTFKFTIDSQMLEYEIFGTNSKFYSNDYVYIKFDDSKIKASITLNDEVIEYYSETSLLEEGEYKLILESKEIPDKVYELNFTIDKTAPELELSTISSIGFVFENNIYYTNNNWSANFIESYTCSIDDGSTKLNYSSDKIIKEEGTYKLELIDLAGNSTIYYICIDKSKISFNLLNENDEKLDYILDENSSITKQNYYNESIKLKLPEGAKVFINDEEYNPLDPITEEGTYNLTLINKLGTASSFKFIIDKTAPKIELTGLNENKKACETVRITVEEQYTYEKYLNDAIFNSTTISENGTYNLVVKDLAGNTSSISFEILNQNLKDFVELSQDENSESITLKINDLNSYTIFIDGETVENLEGYNNPGKHNLKIVDDYGNEYTASFTINSPVSPNYIFANVMTYILIALIIILVIVFIIKKTKSIKKNPYMKG